MLTYIFSPKTILAAQAAQSMPGFTEAITTEDLALGLVRGSSVPLEGVEIGWW
jgi:hypothetical protein